MTDLVTFLNQRLDDDQRIAEDAVTRRGPDWAVGEEKPRAWGDDMDDTEIIAGGKPILTVSVEYGGGILAAAHIARHDPARVLADVTAKRAILALDNTLRAQQEDWYGKALDDVMRLLAQPYNAHPDFDPAWAVDVSASAGGAHPV